CQQYSDWISF
nr:immunoglobulin light chain junction region [Macaca mulatta]MOX54286.1 immunoglobulin light chain junction region [Macaca mulatta]MOX54690.1 immunoglobulin light chain junction region [Macaca mulatta]MOX58350.1 immunoglobulin light chain junction region [Macaca mulatta]